MPQAVIPRRAMVLAAGLGTRMRPLTAQRPKPLVEVAGKALIDHVLDRLAAAGVARAVVNVHYLSEQIIAHLAARKAPAIVISDERIASGATDGGDMLGTGGAVVKALPELGAAPFFHLNSDSIWLDGGKSNLLRLAEGFDAAAMDALLMLAPTRGNIGYDGPGDFAMAADGRLRRSDDAPFVYTGTAILAPALLTEAPRGKFSLTDLFMRAAAGGRLHGLRLDGLWMHIGTPEAIGAAEAALRARR